MSSTVPAFSEDEFERERERREAEKRRKLMRRERKKDRDLVNELESLRQGRRRKPEEEVFLGNEDFDLNDDHDLGDRDGNESSDRFERGFFDDRD
jgi:hypothetical protein